MEKNKKRVAVIGGGNGSAIVLDGLKRYPEVFDISAVISMSDSGGSSGRLRKELGTLPPGDIMRAVLALSKYDYSILRKIFYNPRFTGLGEKLEGHNPGNLFLTLVAGYSGDFLKGLAALAQAVEARGQVFPATMSSSDLVAELDNGDIIRTEAFIDNPKYNRGLKIKKVWLEPEIKVYDKAAEAIKAADYIVLSPGSLYTSLVAALLPKGIKEAIAASSAKLIYAAGNSMRADGETGPENLSGLTEYLERYLPRPVDIILYNNHELNMAQKVHYAEKKWILFGFDKENLSGRKIEIADFEADEGGLSSGKLGELLYNSLKN